MLGETEENMCNYINYCEKNENPGDMDIEEKSKTLVNNNNSDNFKKQYGFSSKNINLSNVNQNKNINIINNNDTNNAMTEEKQQEEDIYNNIYYTENIDGEKENFYGDFNPEVEVNSSYASYHVSNNQTSENFTEKKVNKTEATNDNTNK